MAMKGAHARAHEMVDERADHIVVALAIEHVVALMVLEDEPAEAQSGARGNRSESERIRRFSKMNLSKPRVVSEGGDSE